LKGENIMKKAKFFHNAKVILLGIVNALEGAGVATLIASAVHLFVACANGHGYWAILQFVLGIVALVIACVYAMRMGNRIVHSGKYVAKEVSE
jgi:hypothetical protein